MAKYTVTPQQGTYGWHWQCKRNPSIHGYEHSKKEARRAAREACKGGEAEIIPPQISISIVNGYIEHFSYENIMGIEQTFTTEDIPEEIIEYIFGYDSLDLDYLDQTIILKSILKLWGIYLSGDTMDDISETHNLTLLQARNIINKKYEEIEINIDDEDRTKISWNFTARDINV